MFSNPEFWVAVAFIIMLCVFAYVGAHKTLLSALDHRADRIKAELDDARRLKEEATKVLADYKARSARAEAEAQEIVRASVQVGKVQHKLKLGGNDAVHRRPAGVKRLRHRAERGDETARLRRRRTERVERALGLQPQQHG